MAAAGAKKGKKGKKTTLNLNEFLADTNGTTHDGKVLVNVKTKSWADAVDDDEVDDTNAPTQRVALPTAPRAARQELDLSKLPDQPPFTAYVGNLSYDVDEAVLEEFFQKLSVASVRLMREQGRMKGYGYVEFNDKASLVEALGMSNESLKNRKIRIDLAGQSNDRSGTGGDRDREGGRRQNSTISGDGDADNDWRKTSAQTPMSNSGYGRSDDGSGMRRYDNQRSYESSDFGGPRRGYDDRGYEPPRRDYGSSRGYSFDDHGSGPRRYDDREGSGSDSRRTLNRFQSADGGYERGREAAEPPRERPRLQLQPRSKPAESTDESVAKATVFGGAKPVDTAAREREIDERLQRQKEQSGATRPAHSSSRDFNSSSHRDYAGASHNRDYEPPSHRDNPRESSFASRDIRVNVERRVYDGSERVEETPVAREEERNVDQKQAKAEPYSKPEVEAKAEQDTKSEARKASIFGSAKPVDTAARERQIEEKLRQQHDGSSRVAEGSKGAPARESAWGRPQQQDSDRQREDEHRDLDTVGRSNEERGAWSRNKDTTTRPAGSKDDPKKSAASGPPAQRKERREKHLPQSIEEMPMFEEQKVQDFSDNNKYAGLLPEEDDDNSGSDV